MSAFLDRLPFLFDDAGLRLLHLLAALYPDAKHARRIVDPHLDWRDINASQSPLDLWMDLLEHITRAGSLRAFVGAVVEAHAGNRHVAWLQVLLGEKVLPADEREPVGLAAVLRSATEMRLVELARRLLLECRAYAVRIRADLARTERHDALVQQRREFQKYFRELGPVESLEREDLEALAEQLEVATRATSAHLAVRAAVDGLDESLGIMIAGGLRNRRVLADMEIVPFEASRLVIALDDDEARVLDAAPLIDRARHFGLPPHHAGFEVVLDGSAADALAVLRYRLKVETIDPGLGFGDITYERYVRDDRTHVFNIRPLDPSAHDRRMIELIESAARSGNVVLCPELMAAGTGAARAAVIVAGTHHTPASRGPGDNVATIVMDGGGSRVVRKRRPTRWEIGDEDLQGQNEVTVFYSAGWSFVVLIGEDVLDPELQRLLMDLRVKLVLIPAFCASAELMERVQLLPKISQAVVYTANSSNSDARIPQVVSPST